MILEMLCSLLVDAAALLVGLCLAVSLLFGGLLVAALVATVAAASQNVWQRHKPRGGG